LITLLPAPDRSAVSSVEIADIRQYSIKRTAQILDYSVRTVYRLIDAGELETTGNRHMLRVTHTSIVAYQQRIHNQKEAC
jgi:hypothetical protein